MRLGLPDAAKPRQVSPHPAAEPQANTASRHVTVEQRGVLSLTSAQTLQPPYGRSSRHFESTLSIDCFDGRRWVQSTAGGRPLTATRALILFQSVARVIVGGFALFTPLVDVSLEYLLVVAVVASGCLINV
jgi:hypothetical protein